MPAYRASAWSIKRGLNGSGQPEASHVHVRSTSPGCSQTSEKLSSISHDPDQAGIAVNLDCLPVPNRPARAVGAEDRWDAVLARHDRAVAEDSTRVRHD